MVDEMMMSEDVQPVCPEGDWQCLLKNFYKGYILLLEAIIDTGEVDENGEPILKVNSINVTDFTNDEINQMIQDIKDLYPNIVECRLHYCGNHLGKPCKLISV